MAAALPAPGDGPIMGSFGPIRCPVYAPTGKEALRTAAFDEERTEVPELSYVHGFSAEARQSILLFWRKAKEEDVNLSRWKTRW